MEMIMNPRPYILTLMFVGTSACQVVDNAANAAYPFDAEQELAAWLRAWNTRDLTLADALFLKDTSVTYFSSEREGLIHGFDAIREHHAGFGFVPGGSTPHDELWVEDFSVSVYPQTAVITGIWHFGDRANARGEIQKGPMTVVYVWDGGAYKIAHMNFAEYPPPPAQEGGGTG
jgi:hypothetical protein